MHAQLPYANRDVRAPHLYKLDVGGCNVRLVAWSRLPWLHTSWNAFMTHLFHFPPTYCHSKMSHCILILCCPQGCTCDKMPIKGRLVLLDGKSGT